MNITVTQLLKLRQKAGNKLLDILVELSEDNIQIDIVVDKLVRILTPLAENPDGRPYIHLFPQGLSLKEYRIQAANRIEELLSDVKITNFGEADYILDTLLRELNKLPTRPEGRKPYEGLFKIESEYNPFFTCKYGLATDQCNNAKLILMEAHKQGVIHRAQLGYLLATAEHESGLRPICEGYSEAAGRAEARKRGYHGGEEYYGRGFVQLTHIENYIKYAKILNLPLVGNPNLVLRPDIAAFILVHGCKYGTFTSKKLDDYINDYKIDFYNCRRVINGLDRAEHIAKLANGWLHLL